MKGRLICSIFISCILSLGLIIGLPESKSSVPKDVYRVYLKGESLGLIESKAKLERYIDQGQQILKEQYKVDKVYAPTDLNIVKEITFDEKISSVEQIYDKIKDISPFTINGYKITINGIEETSESGETAMTPTEYVYVLDENIFTEAADKTIRSFIDNNEYDAFLNSTQKEIVDVGKYVEDIYIENNITIKKENIPVDKKIFTNVDDLSRYLLFGTLDIKENYTVQEGDTIEDVAFNNKMSQEEFLIANPQFTSASSLLYPGQQVTLGILQPKFKTVEEYRTVELEEVKYKTEIVYDDNLLIGYSEVRQKGENGTQKVTKSVVTNNGELAYAHVDKNEIVKPVINEVIVRGGKSTSYGDVNLWAWPTRTPYVITSNYGWRWGSFHDGIDISGTGYGSPIYAANNGVVEVSSYTSVNGEYIVINHNNGYYTIYAHLANRYVSAGQHVEMGKTVIGTMGDTGWATGPHLHFGIWKGFPYYGGTHVSPWVFYGS